MYPSLGSSSSTVADRFILFRGIVTSRGSGSTVTYPNRKSVLRLAGRTCHRNIPSLSHSYWSASILLLEYANALSTMSRGFFFIMGRFNWYSGRTRFSAPSAIRYRLKDTRLVLHMTSKLKLRGSHRQASASLRRLPGRFVTSLFQSFCILQHQGPR